MMKREDIRIRDPFIVTDKEHNCYYMYGTTDLEYGSLRAGHTFTVYKSYDLENFDDGKIIFDGSEIGFWADRDYWAPEVHIYNGKYYLFGSFKSKDHRRATQILVCDTPDGKFKPISQKPVTPEDWECLDGTLWVENGTPYIVFCHEWVQITNGEICAMPLTEDLSAPAGEPFMLFRASDNPYVEMASKENYVTDGPFLYNDGDGKTKMIWSSFRGGKYAIFHAESDSIHGQWMHGAPHFDFDGGHAMLFETLDGKKMISLHSPNKANYERAQFYEI